MINKTFGYAKYDGYEYVKFELKQKIVSTENVFHARGEFYNIFCKFKYEILAMPNTMGRSNLEHRISALTRNVLKSCENVEDA